MLAEETCFVPVLNVIMFPTVHWYDVMMMAQGTLILWSGRNAGLAWAAWRVMGWGQAVWPPHCSHGSEPILSNITQLSLSRSLKYKLLLIINIKYYISLENSLFWQCLVFQKFIVSLLVEMTTEYSWYLDFHE